MGEHWTREFYRKGDSFDVDAATASFTPDVRLTFGNNPTVEGIEAVREAYAASGNAFKSVRHHIDEVWDPKPGVTIVEAHADYVRHDDEKLTLPVMMVIRHHGGGEKIYDYRVYMDIAPVFGDAR
ncbi:nuclear transport factor 2 family protein [Amycolatopsis pithecellobii]|uniref:SnoaL-like domain-containing protein n=1 Tax=Amycolatopsis pithecellobii TaxID=664692 RepID=A0A6N7Z2W0_9PSEU|nr:nuclear transport factor 2 family protein [Amycolatopsis pithecellobii]MTD54451.1 hypothetical protein [Amycolatopsis pithecellobii]